MTTLTDRNYVVTGAAGILGRTLCRQLLDAGARVAALDLSEDALAAALPASEHCLPIAVDLLDAEALLGARDRVLDGFGAVDGLVNVAGGFAMGDAVHETAPAAWARLFDLNVNTLVRAAEAFVPAVADRRGAVVNVGARPGLRGSAGMGAYSASKSAVHRLTEAMDEELRAQGVNVNAVLPSIIDTPTNRSDMPDADFDRWVSPASLAGVILFLLSPAAADIHGALIPVEGLS